MVLILAALAGGAVAIGVALRDSATTASPRSSPSGAVAPSVPAPTPTPPERGRLIIHGAGDVSLDPGYIPAFQSNGYGYAWSGLGGLFRRDDLTVVNLECPAATGGSIWPGKQFNFRCDPAALPAMKDAGVEVAHQGNNHAYDYGPEALLESRRNIRRAGMASTGTGKDPDQATQPARFVIKGWRIAVVGFDQVLDPQPEEQAQAGHPGTACGHDVDCMVEAIRRAAATADLVIVVIHWGVELDTAPRAEQIEEGHRFIRAGADVILGHHSHRLQPLETYKGRPIFYGLGNFVWPNHSVAGATTAVAEVTVTARGTFKARLIPAFIESSGHPVLRGE
jgi:poly-gamma-glutamate synthesis protein (capsule biosynthesis protein)